MGVLFLAFLAAALAGLMEVGCLAFAALFALALSARKTGCGFGQRVGLTKVHWRFDDDQHVSLAGTVFDTNVP